MFIHRAVRTRWSSRRRHRRRRYYTTYIFGYCMYLPGKLLYYYVRWLMATGCVRKGRRVNIYYYYVYMYTL